MKQRMDAVVSERISVVDERRETSVATSDDETTRRRDDIFRRVGGFLSVMEVCLHGAPANAHDRRALFSERRRER